MPRLGVPDGVRAVLYAPTWRDDVYFDASKPQVRLPLDTERFAEVLGEDWMLLPRLHSMVTDRMPPLHGHGVYDVSWYPEVADLYLAADVLVTDYSSCMFDFAVTGKPILYLAPDLDRFRDSVRGFYFDPLPGLPGPLLTETDQVLDALRDLDAVQERFAGRYAAFRDTFGSLEDGDSTDRVLQQALGIVVQADPVLGGAAGSSTAD
ncbi:hypothetical protein GCM10025868_10130 [Angustibacter aerolatus]|uniref:CDP-glycerol--glycerophosphate glycerophosphotransferase n=1 Tax=Angustibacter aerolatus TaxID=1162965 RepID=A0ABQ6JC57_9ACTN|nr:hypothetical protein GCM10025868_10130 [Angustibacter aerolatus]